MRLSYPVPRPGVHEALLPCPQTMGCGRMCKGLLEMCCFTLFPVKECKYFLLGWTCKNVFLCVFYLFIFVLLSSLVSQARPPPNQKKGMHPYTATAHTFSWSCNPIGSFWWTFRDECSVVVVWSDGQLSLRGVSPAARRLSYPHRHHPSSHHVPHHHAERQGPPAGPQVSGHV